jgi:hypothetical protein
MSLFGMDDLLSAYGNGIGSEALWIAKLVCAIGTTFLSCTPGFHDSSHLMVDELPT